MRRLWLILTLCGGFAAPAAAQTGAIVTAQLQLYAPGVAVSTPTPTLTTNVPMASFVCGQVPPPLVVVGTVIVPHRIVIDDVPVAGAPRVCIADLTAFFATITPVVGDYLTTITVTNDFGDTSPRSAASPPFRLLKPPPPAAWTGLRVIP